MTRNLEQTLLALDSAGVPVTITMLWDRGIDYALIPFSTIGTGKEEWDNADSVADLAEALHRAAVRGAFKIPAQNAYFKKSTAALRPGDRTLERTMQALYDSEINFTVTKLGDTGVHFALVSYMDYHDLNSKDWHHLKSYADLAKALHHAALMRFPDSSYARHVG